MCEVSRILLLAAARIIVLHALRHDGLEFLWTPDWVCSWPFEDPDAEFRSDFDGPPIEARSMRRMRARRFPNGVADEEVNEDPSHEVENEVGVADATPTEFTSEHIQLR